MDIFLYQISYLAIAVGGLFFVFFLLRRPKESIISFKAQIFFLLMNLSLASWAVSRYFLLIVETGEGALLWSLASIFFHVLIYAFFLHFILLFMMIGKRGSVAVFISYIFVVFFGLLAGFDWFFNTSFLIDSVENKMFFPWHESAGQLHFAFLLYAIIVPIYFGIEMMIYGIMKEKINIAQIFSLIFIIMIGFLGGGTTLFLTYNINIPPFGVPLVFLQLITTIYYAARYQHSGLKIIANIIHRNIIIVIFSLILFFSGNYLASSHLGGIFSFFGSLFIAFLAFLFALFLIFTINYFQDKSEILFLKRFNPHKEIKELVAGLNNSIELDIVFDNLVKSFNKFLGVRNIHILIFVEEDQKTKKICLSEEDSFNCLNINLNDIFFKRALQAQKIIISGNTKGVDKSLAEKMEELNIKVFAPLMAGEKNLGLIILGEKMSQKKYTEEDIEFLEIIIAQASTIIEKALLYKKTSEFNQDLKAKVKKQKKKLNQQSEHLKKILAMREEFLDIASHQLRAPVTVIKGVLSMLLEGSIKNKNEEKKFLDACFEKSVKLTNIIDDILRASKMDNEKLILDLESIDIKDLLYDIYNNKKKEIADKKLKFYLELPKEHPAKVLSDKRYLEEAIVNLVNNAIQYTKKGFVKIKVEEDWDKKQTIIKIIDSGIGIPEKDQKKLFKKFVRAENASEAFPDGSGLGLFIVKQVVDAQENTKVFIEKSEVGKGTTFVLKIPMIF